MPHDKVNVVHSFFSLKKKKERREDHPQKVYIIAKGYFNWKIMDFVNYTPDLRPLIQCDPLGNRKFHR